MSVGEISPFRFRFRSSLFERQLRNGQRITGKGLSEVVGTIAKGNEIRTQLDRRADIRILAPFIDAQLTEADFKDRPKLERLEANVLRQFEP